MLPPIDESILNGRFLAPRNAPRRPWLDYEWGGANIHDGSRGIHVKMWKGEYIDDQIFLSAEGVPPVSVLTVADVDEFQFTFDRDMHVFVTYRLINGAGFYYWYDPLIPGYTTVGLPFLSSYPRCAHDDVRDSAAATSDIVIAYMIVTSLYYRVQRERFEIEHLVGDSLIFALGIYQIGMNTDYRFQFQMNYVDPSIVDV